MAFPSRFYFAFGSNMNPTRVSERGLRFRSLRGAWLDDYALQFNKTSAAHAGTGHANIQSSPGARVEGVLYELADFHEILKMDPFEHVSVNYSRLLVNVWRRADEPVEAWTYVATPAARRDGLLPEAGYLGHLLKGRPWLSEPYFDRLSAWPVLDRSDL